jgi:formylglycine-generating enzyme required for sulfatase activity
VGSFEANPFGLYDTVGNVWEWSCSEYEEKYNGKENQCISQKSGSLWVRRGGAWSSIPRGVRAANRTRSSHGIRNDNLGFRLTRVSRL